MLSDGVEYGDGFGMIEGEWFFTEDMFSGFCGADGPHGMEGMGKGDENDLHIRIFEERLIGGVGEGDMMGCGELFSGFRGAGSHGEESAGARSGECFCEDGGHLARSEDSPLNFVRVGHGMTLAFLAVARKGGVDAHSIVLYDGGRLPACHGVENGLQGVGIH